MARYKTFQYGDGTHYGKSAITEAGDLTWIFLVDWDGDGTYDGTNEMAWCKQFSMSRGRENYLSLEGNGFEHMGIDSATLVMDDPDRRYDPRNTGSDLSPNVFPGKKCQVSVLDNLTDPRTRYTRFSGYIDSISPMTGSNEVTITCKGNLQPVADAELTTHASHINTSIYESFINLLDEAGYTGGIDIDSDSQPIVSFGVDGMSAAQVAGQLADAALGNFFVDVNGVAKFYSRDHSYPASIPIDENVCLKNFVISQPWDGVFKQVDVICRRQIKEQPSIVFYLSNPLPLTIGTPADLFPSFQSSSDIAISASAANTLADGSGTDILTSTSLETFAIGPSGGQISFNTSVDGFLTKLEIQGRRWEEVIEKFSYSATPKPYDRKFTLDTPWLQDRNYANSFMGTLRQFLDDDRENLIIQIEGRPSTQFSLDLLDKISFTSATYDITAENYWVMGISEEWMGDTGQLAQTTFYLGKIVTDSTSIIPASVEEEAEAPLGLNDPPGTEITDTGDDDTGGDDVIKILNPCCFGYSVGSYQPTAYYGDIVLSITTIINNPDSMMKLNDSNITIPEDGHYLIGVSGHVIFSSANEDVLDYSGRAYASIRLNGSQIGGYYKYGSRYSTSALNPVAYEAYSPFVADAILECSTGQIISVANHWSVFDANNFSQYQVIQWNIKIGISKIRDL